MNLESPVIENPVSHTSRYYRTKMHIDDSVKPGAKRLGLWKAPAVSTIGAASRVVSIAEVGVIDNISYDVYQQSELWWVLAQASGIKDVFSEMVTGTMITVPVKRNLFEALGED